MYNAKPLNFLSVFPSLRRLLNMKFDPSVGYMLATTYMEKGQLLDAKLLFEKLSEESDSFYKVHYVSNNGCLSYGNFIYYSNSNLKLIFSLPSFHLICGL